MFFDKAMYKLCIAINGSVPCQGMFTAEQLSEFYVELLRPDYL